jgi:molecular chaperone HtpG
MSLIINTFYSNKDIFLRELVSNASDAIDKIRYQALTDAQALAADPDMRIRIYVNKDARTMTIDDTGVGMTKADLIQNLGTIARSGTRTFMEGLSSSSSASASSASDLSLIGQFGVGFYAAYLVAQSVLVLSKHNEEAQAYAWQSEAGGSFTLRPATQEEAAGLKRGTRITLHLKEDAVDYLEPSKLKSILSKHCGFIDAPIELQVERTEEVEVEEEEEEEQDKKEEEVDGKVEDAEKEEEGDEEDSNKKTKTVIKKDWERVNAQKPIWLRPPEEIQPDAYAAFYKSLTHDWNDHLAVKHFSVEGAVVFKSILFVPKQPPMDMFSAAGGQQGSGKHSQVKLYVRRVFITDQCEDLLPEYLGFIKGVVDSDDLPLNISREMLQQNRVLKVIGKNLVRRSLDMISEMAAEKPDDYKTFYEGFSKSLKLGVHEDSHNRLKLLDLLRFASSAASAAEEDAGGTVGVSLKEYVARMKEGQKDIYYITGESKQAVENSPFLEKLKRKGYEVLYMTDPIDEYMMQQVRVYEGKNFVCCTKADMKLDDDEVDAEGDAEDEARKAKEQEWEPVCKRIQEILGNGRIVKVTLSSRIVDSPCVLVTDAYSWSANMQRIMKAQALHDSKAQSYMAPRKILEINAEHKILQTLKKWIQQQEQSETAADGQQQYPQSKTAQRDLVMLMYEAALLSSGFSLDAPNSFANRIYRMLEVGLGMDEEEDDEKEQQGATQSEGEGSSRMEEVD